jgi:hypothetical protein
VLVSVQDWCTVCTKRTIGSKIILDAPNGIMRWWGSSESSVHLEIVLFLMQDRCNICVAHTIGTEIILDAPDGTTRWRGSCGISLLSVWRKCYYRFKIGAQFASMYHRLCNHFGHTRWSSLVTRLKWKLCLFGDSANLTQDRRTVCVKRTVGSKIILDAPDGTPRWCGSCGISLLSVWRRC